MHSTCSDGSESPSSVIDLAVESGCSTVALTDHDSLSGLRAARTRAEEVGINFINGCEVSCNDAHGTIHLLIYFVPVDGPFDDFLSEAREDRTRRNAELVDKLGWLGMPIDLEELAAEAGPGVVGRPHFAALLVRHGHATSIADAFGRYLADGGAAYVPRAALAPATVIDRARSAGAVVSLAHPHAIGLDRSVLSRYVRSLADIGLVGLESIYGRYDPETRAALVELARGCGLVPTGGSDFHGTYKPDLSVGIGSGDLNVPDEIVDELFARRTLS
ncbi:MAG TPA: PHP domain-containing protein [Acidimicrobiales bacterium]|nr:PHP domain-containing protein [Acidimicrobiales bacterium]